MERTNTFSSRLMPWRRQRAWQLSQQGWCQRDLAEVLDVTPGAVSQWLKRARLAGPEALLPKPRSGRPPKLTATQRQTLPDWLGAGPQAFGFRGDVWTCAQVAKVIENEFGVRYHKSQVSRLLEQLGWTPQTPRRRARQRDEEQIERWRDEVWPKLKKRLGRKAVP